MRTFATLKNLSSSKNKDVIVRNLNRILDIVILDVDIENSTVTLLYASEASLDRAKRELHSIGFPIMNLQIQTDTKTNDNFSRTLA